MDAKNKDCKQCIGVGGCEKYCKLHIGEALEKLFTEITLIKTRIGDYDRRVRGGKLDLIVSGHRIDAPNEECYYLTDISTMLDKSSKFENVYNQNVVSILNEYFATSVRFTPEYKTEIIDKLKEFNSNRQLALPFKTRKTFNVDVETSSGKKNLELPLDFIKWSTNKQNGKLEATLMFKNEITQSAPKYIPVTYSDYMINFRPSKNGVYTDAGTIDDRLIRVTDFGLIKPIQVFDGDTRIVVDNTYLYYVSINGTITIIGKWDGDKINGYNSVKGIEKTKAFKYIKNNFGIIKMHRRYIIPYNLADLNIVTI